MAAISDFPLVSFYANIGTSYFRQSRNPRKLCDMLKYAVVIENILSSLLQTVNKYQFSICVKDDFPYIASCKQLKNSDFDLMKCQSL